MSSFRQLFQDALPPRMTLPPEFAATFDWIEANGGVGTSRSSEPFAVIAPEELNALGGSSAYFHKPFTDNHWVRCWDEAEMSRFSTFMGTGGDGSSAAFWLDDDGVQHIVHLGSGSGSIMAGLWVREPLDLLRLLAIGYTDLCWPEDYGSTPAEIAAEQGATAIAPPLRFRNWLTQTFGVSIPERASEIVGPMPQIGEDESDPFNQWCASLEARGLVKP